MLKKFFKAFFCLFFFLSRQRRWWCSCCYSYYSSFLKFHAHNFLLSLFLSFFFGTLVPAHTHYTFTKS
jgi:hypothetical protein